MLSPDNLIFLIYFGNHLWTWSLWACFSDLDELSDTYFKKILFRGFQANRSNKMSSKLLIQHLFETGMSFTPDQPFQHNWVQDEHPVTVLITLPMDCTLYSLCAYISLCVFFSYCFEWRSCSFSFRENRHVPQVFMLCFLLSLLNIPATTISTESALFYHLRAQNVRYYPRMSLLLLSVFLARILSE